MLKLLVFLLLAIAEGLIGCFVLIYGSNYLSIIHIKFWVTSAGECEYEETGMNMIDWVWVWAGRASMTMV